MTFLLALCFLASDSIPSHPARVDSLGRERVDTLGEVLVQGRERLAVMDAIDGSLKANRQPGTKSLGDILNKVAPNAMDYVMHPFGFKERKQKRQRKRTQQNLEQYDQMKTFNELLDEAVRRQKEEDERNK